MLPDDEPFAKDGLDAWLGALARGADPSPDGPTSRAYRGLSQLYAPAAAREAGAIERVRRRLAALGAGATDVSATPALAEPATAPGTPPPVPMAVPPTHDTRRPGQPRRPRTAIGGVARGCAAVLVVGALVSGFAALLAARQWGLGAQSLTSYHWHRVPSPNSSQVVNSLNGVTARAGDDTGAWGMSTDAPSPENSNPIPVPLVERWDGQAWRIVPTPPVPYGGQIADIAALAPDDAWAVGSSLITPTWSDNTTGASLIEHWDGHSWSIVPGPSVSATISDIVALGPDDVWAVGTESVGLAIDVAQNGHSVIAHWDGHAWSLVANPTPRPYTSLPGVAANPATPGTVWVVGTTGPQIDHGDQPSDTQTLIETNG